MKVEELTVAGERSRQCRRSSQSSLRQTQPGRPRERVGRGREAAWERRQVRERVACSKNHLQPDEKNYCHFITRTPPELTSEWSESEGHSHRCPVDVEGEAGHVTVT